MLRIATDVERFARLCPSDDREVDDILKKGPAQHKPPSYEEEAVPLIRKHILPGGFMLESEEVSLALFYYPTPGSRQPRAVLRVHIHKT